MCGKYIGEQSKEIICPDCLRILPRTEQDTLRQNITEMTLTESKVMHLNRAAAFLFYEKDTPIQGLIHKMKYADQPEIAYYLGRQAAMEFQYSDFFDGIDIIMPVPLHPKRLRERGYNQSEYIARGISEVTGIPIDTTHVVRSRNTPKQALQKGDERKQNVSEAFTVNHPEQMYHKHILLVDDLITTGETAKACLHAMKKFRGASFSVFSLCKAS
jgi:ComF family protein